MRDENQPSAEGTDVDVLFTQLDVPLPLWLTLVLLCLITVGGIAAGLNVLRKSWGWVVPRVRRWRALGRQDQRRAERRKTFASHVEGRMRRLGEKEEWRDDQYAELEAEIEIRRPRRQLLWRRSAESGIRRVPSLSEALASVTDKLVVLEGEPGSGKSIALRHLTAKLAMRVVHQPTEFDPIPLYVNLKELTTTGGVTAADIRALVFASLNRARDRKVDRFLEAEFDKGMEEGSWLFLFDSFDEIPAVLGATEADAVVEEYSDAIYDFLNDLGNKCRGIVASREFRGPPGKYSWPKFRVMALSEARKAELVRRADLTPSQEAEVLDGLGDAVSEVYAMSDNPMFLSLLCEHIREGHPFPENAHVVIESFVQARFERDATRIRDLFVVKPEAVRAVAEELAFRIADHDTLGLTVRWREAERLLSDRWSPEELSTILDALVYTKLARDSDDTSEIANERTVTFSHRRLQEYFATCVVLREPDRVPSRALVTDGRWRETAVTILQSATYADTLAVYQAASDVLAEFPPTGERFDWQPGQFHLLSVLSEGGGSAKYPVEVPALRQQADALLEKAWTAGSRRDRKWVLEVCAAAGQEQSLAFVREAFQGGSQWLRDHAYAQTRRLRVVEAELETEIRQILVDFSLGGGLRRSRTSIRTQISRFPTSAGLLQAMRLLLAIPIVDFVLGVLAAGLLGFLSRDFQRPGWLLLTWVLTGLTMRMASVRGPALHQWWRKRLRWTRLAPGSNPFEPARHSKPSTYSTLGTILLVRIAASMLIFARTDSFQGRSGIAAVVTLGFGLWAGGALIAAQSGKRLAMRHWPGYATWVISPFFTIVKSRRIGAVRHVLPAAWRAVRSGEAMKAAKALAKLLIGGSVIFGLAYMLKLSVAPVHTFIDSHVKPVVDTYVKPFVDAHVWSVTDDLGPAVIAFMPTILACAIGAVAVFRVVHGRWATRVDLPSGEPVTVEWIAARLGRTRRAAEVADFLENLRGRNPKPDWDPDAVEFLLAIARTVDASRQSDALRRLWALRSGNPGEAEKYASEAVLDEIARVHEDVSVRLR